MLRIAIHKLVFSDGYAVQVVNKEKGIVLEETRTTDKAMIPYIVKGYRKLWNIKHRISLSDYN